MQEHRGEEGGFEERGRRAAFHWPASFYAQEMAAGDSDVIGSGGRDEEVFL